MLEVCNLVKCYGSREVVRGVSFTLRPGEAVAYLGPNGAGKSTTLKMIAGLVTPTGGQVRVCGHDLGTEPLEVKRRLGYVPDHASLFETLTPNEYLSLSAELYHLDRDRAGERIRQMYDAFDLTDQADHYLETLSRGQRQKVLLMAALLHEPEVLLLDEPLNGLDVNAALTLRRVLERLLERGRTVLFCSHIFELAERLCSRVLVLHEGRLVADDTTPNLLGRSREGTLEAVFRQLTRPEEADETARALLESFARSPATHA
jgi:ABC-2 type transport system ATP-binding protein